jgi:hypothetical protein
MTTKSHVSLEQHICPVCGVAHDTGAILLDKRLKPSMHMHTATGYSLCADHKAKAEEGYIALVEIDPKLSVFKNDSNVEIDGMHRTGRYAHIHRKAWDAVFNIPALKGNVVCLEPAAYNAIAALVALVSS